MGMKQDKIQNSKQLSNKFQPRVSQEKLAMHPDAPQQAQDPIWFAVRTHAVPTMKAMQEFQATDQVRTACALAVEYFDACGEAGHYASPCPLGKVTLAT